MTLVVTHPYVSTVTETTPSGGAGGTVGPTEWNANHTLTGVASPAQGGTGITSGTGVTFFSSATVLADSGTLPLNQVLLGGGANASPTFVSTLGSTLQVLYGGSPPQWGTAATTTGSTGGGGSVGGSSGSVQFSTGGTFGGDTNFTYTPGGQVAINLSSSTSSGLAGLSIVTSSSSQMQSDAAGLKITGTWNNSGTTYDAPFFMNVTNIASGAASLLMDVQVGGTSSLSLSPSRMLVNGFIAGASGFYSPTSGSAMFYVAVGSNHTILGLNSCLTFGSGDAFVGGDTTLYRDGASATLALTNEGSKTSPATFRVYNTTDQLTSGIAPTNYERGVFDWTTTANVLTIGTQAGGTGTARQVQIVNASQNGYLISQGTKTVAWDNVGLYIGGGGTPAVVFSSGTDPYGTSSVNINRVATNVIAFGSGGATNTAGWMQWGGQARVSSNVTSSSTTLANVTGLSVNLQSSRTYSFEAYLFFTDLAAAGIQAAINTTTTSTGYTLTIDGFVIDGSGTFATRGFARATTMGAPVASTLTTGTLGQAVLRGTLTTSSALTANIQFSQIAPNATQTIINTGSYMWVHDMP